MKRFYVLSVALTCTIGMAAQMPVVKDHISKSNVYAGIEVGSKGVKLSVLDINTASAQPGAYTILKDTTVNTDFVSFDEKAKNATSEALSSLYKFASNKYNIAKSKIFTVISSGIKGQADRLEKNQVVNDMIADFKTKINEPERTVEIVDVLEESRLSHLGIIPNERRYNTFLIDIGSGNTKGGYFPNGNTKEMKMFSLNWGTKSVANETEKRIGTDNTMLNFTKNVKRVLNSSVNDEITYAVNASNAYAMSDYIALSGGICWSIATLLYPELNTHTVIPVSYDDVADFVNKISTNPQQFDEAEISKKLQFTEAEKKVMLNELKKVHKAFDQKALISGSNLLLQIMRQFSGVHEKKLFYLVKNGQVGWVSAYVEMMKDKK
jgi:hypothetical protein